MISHSLIGATLGLMLASGAALAQDAAAPAAPAPQGRPEVKPFDDWVVRCFPIASPSPCDIYQELNDQRTQQRVLSFSIAYVPSLDRHGIQITVPLEVSIPRGLVIETDSFKSQPMKYRMCDRTGCFVQMPIENGAINSIAKSGPDAKVRIFADSGKSYELKFSLKGFSAAHDSMVEQARAKAKNVPVQPATAAPAAPAPAP
jgi:invasion protein IalB